jgi:UDP:flavonoid glycosyltransferase YjiC (YdhE family)
MIRARRRRQASIANTELEETVQSLGVDLILVDLEMHFAVIAAYGLGIPILLTTVLYNLFYDPVVPPLNSSIVPGDDRESTRRIGDAWKQIRLDAVKIRFKRRLKPSALMDFFRPVHYTTYRLPDLEAVAASRRFPLRRETDRRQWLRPFIYTRIPILCFCPWELEFPHNRRENVHYVGPMVRIQRKERPLEGQESANWKTFCAERSQARPLVYCSLGSFWSADTALLERIIEAFRINEDWDLVIGLGGKAEVAELTPVPPNVRVLKWAPQLEVLGMADAVITHGGASTIAECMLFGLPMIVYSTGHVDQDGNSARVAYHGLGILGNKDQDGAETIARNVREVLTNQRYRVRAGELQEHCLTYQSSAVAERLVESYLPS